MRKEGGPWLGLEGEAGPPQPPTPRNASEWGGSPSASSLPPPTAPTKGEAPAPGAAPTPAWAVHSVVFSSPGLRGPRGGRGAVRLRGTAAVTRVCWSVGDPQFVPFVFLKDSTHPTKATAKSETSPQKSETKNWLFPSRPLTHTSVSLSPA